MDRPRQDQDWLRDQLYQILLRVQTAATPQPDQGRYPGFGDQDPGSRKNGAGLMRRYEKYKDSGIEWIGEIPEHWEIKKIKHLTKLIGGYAFKSEFFSLEGIPVIRIGDISDNINFELCNKIISEDISIEFFLNQYDTLIALSGATVGKACYINKTPPKAYVNQRVAKIPFQNKFLFYIITSSYIQKQIILTSLGSAQENISNSQIENLDIALTNISSEQTAIATYLDQKTAEIDALITDKKRLLELYEEEKSAIINEAVTKGVASTRLASTRLASTGSAALGGGGLKEKKVLDETPALGGVKMKDSGIEWMGEIPAHWEMKRLRHVAKVQTGCTPLIQNSEIDYFENGTINWYTPSDFHSNDELSISKRQINKKAVEDGQVILFPEYSIYLVSIGATLGKVSFTKETASANQQINVITFYETMLNPIFGYFFFIANKENIKLEADYTTLPILNQSKAKNLLLACPPVEEQKEIAQYIEAETKRIDTKKEKTQKLIDLLTEYRTALISEVVTGKVKVV